MDLKWKITPMKKITKIVLVACFALFLVSFATSLERKTKKALNDGYTFIPSGNVEIENAENSINSFIMSKGEVTNFQWMEFLSDLKAQGETEKLKICQVDSANWNTKMSFNNKYADFYHVHPAYRNYPVVNISKEAAELYCEWLSDHFLPNREGDKKLKFRLPTHEEWIYAAKGGLKLGEYGWGGPFLTNEKGSQLANYVRFGAENISRDSTGKLIVIPFYSGTMTAKDYADVTAPSQSYWPNGFGVYNMNGNVAEMVANKDIVAGGSWKDPGYDIRNESFKPYTGSATNVGFRVVATANSKDVEWLKIKK